MAMFAGIVGIAQQFSPSCFHHASIGRYHDFPVACGSSIFIATGPENEIEILLQRSKRPACRRFAMSARTAAGEGTQISKAAIEIEAGPRTKNHPGASRVGCGLNQRV